MEAKLREEKENVKYDSLEKDRTLAILLLDEINHSGLEIFTNPETAETAYKIAWWSLNIGKIAGFKEAFKRAISKALDNSQVIFTEKWMSSDPVKRLLFSANTRQLNSPAVLQMKLFITPNDDMYSLENINNIVMPLFIQQYALNTAVHVSIKENAVDIGKKNNKFFHIEINTEDADSGVLIFNIVECSINKNLYTPQLKVNKNIIFSSTQFIKILEHIKDNYYYDETK